MSSYVRLCQTGSPGITSYDCVTGRLDVRCEVVAVSVPVQGGGAHQSYHCPSVLTIWRSCWANTVWPACNWSHPQLLWHDHLTSTHLTTEYKVLLYYKVSVGTCPLVDISFGKSLSHFRPFTTIKKFRNFDLYTIFSTFSTLTVFIYLLVRFKMIQHVATGPRQSLSWIERISEPIYSFIFSGL